MADRERYDEIGCGDGNCDFRRPTGMHTNRGCRCFPRHAEDYDQPERSRLRGWVRIMRERIAEQEARIATLEAEKAHAVQLNRELRDRPDLGDRAKSVDALRARIAELEALLHDAFNAGMAYSTGSGRDFSQTHPDRETWVRKALGGSDA